MKAFFVFLVAFVFALPVVAEAAFPTLEGQTNSVNSSGGTSHTVTLQASNAGELLIVLFSQNSSNTTNVTWPAGWTEFMDFTSGRRLAGAWRIADGTEAGTITVTTTHSANSSHAMYRFSGYADPNTTPFQVQTVVQNTDWNPPSLTISGTNDYIVMAVVAGGNGVVSSANDNAPYGFLLGWQSRNATFPGASLHVALNRVQMSGEIDPTSFGASVSEQNAAATIAIQGSTDADSAFPITNQSTISPIAGSSSTSHAFAYPAGIEAGDLLLAFANVESTTTATWPAGWTGFADATYGGSRRLIAGWRKADGSETGTFTVTTGASVHVRRHVVRITGAADPTVQPPEVSSIAAGSSTAPNSPSLTPTGGAKNYKWFTFIGNNAFAFPGNVPDTPRPTNYDSVWASAAENAGNVAVASRNANASSEDPGAWTNSSSVVWGAVTIAVHPGDAASSSPRRRLIFGQREPFDPLRWFLTAEAHASSSLPH